MPARSRSPAAPSSRQPRREVPGPPRIRRVRTARRVAGRSGELAPECQLLAEPLTLASQASGGALVVPEPRREHCRLDLGEAGLLGGWVKDAPRSPRFGRAGPAAMRRPRSCCPPPRRNRGAHGGHAPRLMHHDTSCTSSPSRRGRGRFDRPPRHRPRLSATTARSWTPMGSRPPPSVAVPPAAPR